MSRAVIVTGASRGIGRAIALRFGTEGCDLALIQRGDAAERPPKGRSNSFGHGGDAARLITSCSVSFPASGLP